MKRIIVILLAAISFATCSSNASGVQNFPEADNFGSIDGAVSEYLEAIRTLGVTNELNSIMVIKDGKKLLEYYDCCYGPDFLNICWSASKTFTAVAVGFAVQDGLLSLDSKLVDYLEASELPASVSDTLAGLNVYNLLRMSSGLRLDPVGDTGSGKLKTPVKTVLEGGFIFSPGEKFKYNSHDTYLLSVLVQKATGKKVEDYLKDKLFEPLGICDYHWDVSAEGYNMGGWGLYISTESLAKMGQFFLQNGEWNGKQLLDSAWIEQAMSPQIYPGGEIIAEDDWRCGYGYQMWQCTHNAVRLAGSYGQWSIICPDKNAVIVVTQHVNQEREALKAVWSCIYDKI